MPAHLGKENVTSQNATRAVARGSRDGALEQSIKRSLCRHARADIVPGDVGRIHAGTRSGGFEDCGDRVAMQTGGSYVAVTIDSAKYRAFGDLGLCEPLMQRLDRAGIVMFAKRDRDLVAGLLLMCF